jgi:hypothetical protein
MEEVAINVTQQLQITDYDPVFSGTYSSVHKGTLHGETVSSQGDVSRLGVYPIVATR